MSNECPSMNYKPVYVNNKMLTSLGDFLLQKELYFSQKFKSEILNFSETLKTQGEFESVCVYGSLAKKTWIPGLSDIDMVGYFSNDENDHYHKLESYLFSKFDGKVKSWPTKFTISFNGIKIDFNLEKYSGSNALLTLFKSEIFEESLPLQLRKHGQEELMKELMKELEKDIKDCQTKVKFPKIPSFIIATTKYVLDFCKDGPLKRKFTLICKFWGYSNPKDVEFKSKSLVLECLAIYSYKKSMKRQKIESLEGLFMEFLNMVEFGSESITAVFAEYFMDMTANISKIEIILNHRGPILTDPGNILNALEVPWKSLRGYAKKTRERLNNPKINTLMNLFSGYSQNQISINFLDFTTQETDAAEIITNHQSPHPDTVKFEPEWYQNFVKQNILGSMIALFICYEADMMISWRGRNAVQISGKCLNSLPQKEDILGYFNLNSKNVNEKDKKTVGFEYVFSDQQICIKVKICLGFLEEKSIPMIQFERLQVKCQQNNINWALNYEKFQESEECRLKLTTKDHKELGQFIARDLSKSTSKNRAAMLSLEAWNEMMKNLDNSQVSDIDPVQVSATQHKSKFGELKELCLQTDVVWALYYEKLADSYECRLELTKNRKKLGQFLGEGSTKSKSKNNASLLAFEGWKEMIETFELPQVSSIPENESLQISAIQQTDLFTRLQELSQQNNLEWALNYEKQGDNVECQLTLSTNDGRKRLELGNFKARGSSKSVAKNNAVLLAIENWNGIMRNLQFQEDTSSVDETRSDSLVVTDSSPTHHSDVLKLLQELCSRNDIEWGFNYEKASGSVECRLTLTAKDGKQRLQVGNFTAREPSKVQSRKIAASRAIEDWGKIIQAF